MIMNVLDSVHMYAVYHVITLTCKMAKVLVVTCFYVLNFHPLVISLFR